MKEYENCAGEWIVCKNREGKQNPRTAIPHRIAVITSDYDSWNRLNKELMKSGEYAYKRKSYERNFKKYNLDSLPKRNY